jgi:hypothetical protein
MLPSQVLDQADTLDLHVYDVAMSYNKFLHDKKNKKPSDFYDEGTLQRALKNVRS